MTDQGVGEGYVGHVTAEDLHVAIGAVVVAGTQLEAALREGVVALVLVHGERGTRLTGMLLRLLGRSDGVRTTNLPSQVGTYGASAPGQAMSFARSVEQAATLLEERDDLVSSPALAEQMNHLGGGRRISHAEGEWTPDRLAALHRDIVAVTNDVVRHVQELTATPRD